MRRAWLIGQHHDEIGQRVEGHRNQAEAMNVSAGSGRGLDSEICDKARERRVWIERLDRDASRKTRLAPDRPRRLRQAVRLAKRSMPSHQIERTGEFERGEKLCAGQEWTRRRRCRPRH